MTNRVRIVFGGTYHGNCVGMTPTEVKCLKSKGELYTCPYCATIPSLPSFIPANDPNFSWDLCMDQSSASRFTGPMI